MKNNKGITLITLLVTVIVIVIISSITAYNGIESINDARKKDAEDKMKTMCSAILKDDSFLNFSEGNEVILNQSDFDYMGLAKYYDEKYTFKVSKNEENVENTKTITYELNIEKNDSDINYSYTFDYNLSKEKYNYNVSFDSTNGVNRPIIINGMKATMEDGTEVEDIFLDDWYSYKASTLNFARMTFNNKVYVWVPRFAYDIQTFYEGREISGVPNTAIGIVFLKEDTNYMINDEVIQGDYKVHPAFSKGEEQYSGIWVEEVERDGSVTISSPLYVNNSDYNLHMMTNQEYGAALYLMFSLDDTEQIKFSKDEYVAAVAGSLGNFGSSNGYVTKYEITPEGDAVVSDVYGDAFTETPWNRVLVDYPTMANPYVIRKFNSGLFDFTNSNGTTSAYYRGVITVK